MSPLHLCLLFSAGLFCIGLTAALCRGNAILVLLGIELMLNAVNLTLVALSKHFGAVDGQIFVFFVMAVAAAEAAVGLAIILLVFRNFYTVEAADVHVMRG